MRDTIRCCISCILPCGALDVIRIVHVSGHVEEISGSNVTAADVLKAYPKHTLKKPSSPAGDSCCPKIIAVPPEAELRRGKIYFLIPPPPKSTSARKRRKEKESAQKNRIFKNSSNAINSGSESDTASFLVSDRYLSEILSEKMSTVKDRRRGRSGVWRPHLESISEGPSGDV